MSTEQRAIEASTKLFEASNKEDLVESAVFTEDLIRFVDREAMKRGLSPEQIVFALALSTINFRETCPSGKDWFDQHCARAWEYYEINKDK